MLKRIEELTQEISGESDSPFTSFEEEVLVSIALDVPEYFQSIAHLLNYELFSKITVKYIMLHVLDYYERFNVIPTRDCISDQIRKHLTVDDNGWEEVDVMLRRPANHRDIPIIKDVIHKWARKQAFGKLWTPESMRAYERGDYDKLEEIINSANRIVETSSQGFWFYEQFEELFSPDCTEHLTTGFPQLDRALNNGGPSLGEVVCYMAATGVGKSLVLCNSAIHQTIMGNDVLLVTFELDMIKTAMRCLGVLADVKVNEISGLDLNRQKMVRERMKQNKATAGKLLILDLPPDECSVNHIYSEIHQLRRTRNWSPRVVVIDYLELMLGRRESDNKDDYTRQKQVSNQVRGLARNEHCLGFTATQGNRSTVDSSRTHGNRSSNGNGQEAAAAADIQKVIGLNQIAESYGKSMSLDYVISLNQNDAEYEQGIIRAWIAKNRNGPKHITVNCKVNYETMAIKEYDVRTQ